MLYVINGRYWWALFFLISAIYCRYLGLAHNIPNQNPLNVFAYSMNILLPLHAFIIVYMYNRDDPEYSFTKQFYWALLIMLFVNLLALGAGFKNENHNIEDRLNLPFGEGLYTGSMIIAIVLLMTLAYVFRFSNYRPLGRIWLLGILGISFVLMVMVNSRLTLMTVMLVIGLFFTPGALRAMLTFIASWFTLPLLMNAAELVYWFLTQPFMVAIVQRVDKRDVTSFNGRSELWTDVGDWLMKDQTGIIFGNGYKGNMYLKMHGEFLARTGQTPYMAHTHSTTCEVLLSQGAVGFGLLVLMVFFAFIVYRKLHKYKHKDGPLFIALVFIMFFLQIDNNIYHESFGFCLLSAIVARSVIKPHFLPPDDDEEEEGDEEESPEEQTPAPRRQVRT